MGVIEYASIFIAGYLHKMPLIQILMGLMQRCSESKLGVSTSPLANLSGYLFLGCRSRLLDPSGRVALIFKSGEGTVLVIRVILEAKMYNVSL